MRAWARARVVGRVVGREGVLMGGGEREVEGPASAVGGMVCGVCVYRAPWLWAIGCRSRDGMR